MEIKTIEVGLLKANCYILIKEQQCLIIDPGDDYPSIKKELEGFDVKGILITHRHPDHVGALGQLVNDYNVMIYDRNYFEEKEYTIGDFTFRVVYTFGHTNDSISFYFEEGKVMFTGDFLFKESIGRTDLPTGDINAMRDSIWKVSNFNDAITIYPGHGPSTNLGYEKRNNPFFEIGDKMNQKGYIPNPNQPSRFELVQQMQKMNEIKRELEMTSKEQEKQAETPKPTFNLTQPNQALKQAAMQSFHFPNQTNFKK